MVNLTIADVTVGSGTLTGDGAFDIFMQAAMVHLRREYSEGRINGDKYAEAYIAIMNNVLNVAAQFAVNKVNTTNQAKVQEAQIADEVDGKPVTGVVGKQKAVYDAQIKGFKDDALQKAAKMLVDTWSVRKSTDTDGTIVDGTNKLEDASIGKAIKALGDSVGIQGL